MVKINKSNKLNIFSAFILLIIGASNSAWSATQGVLALTSTGDFGVTFVILDKVRISGLTDFDFGTYNPPGNIQNNADICIYSNMPGATYQITASGDGTGSAFTAQSGGNEIPYSVEWNDQTTTVGNVALTSTITLVGQTGANATTNDCSIGGNSANVEVIFNQSDLTSKPNGNYLGVLTITIDAV